MLIDLAEARIVGEDGFLRRRTERVLQKRYGIVHKDDAPWHLRAGAWPVQRPRIPPVNGRIGLYGAGESFIDAEAPRRERVPELDVRFDPKPRIAQVLTTFHRGGAEKIAKTLAEKASMQTLLVAIDLPRRSTWSMPEPFFQATGKDRRLRIEQALAAVLEFGADIVHAHLLDGDTLRAFSMFPIISTAHNVPAAWPPGLSEDAVDLLIGCAKHIGVKRTIWNGVDTPRDAEPLQLVGNPKIAVVANARPQKRFDRLPAILNERPEAHIYVAGEPGDERHERLHWLGPLEEPAQLLRAADALLSVSDYEGLSLAELEAKALGLTLELSDCAAHHELATIPDALTGATRMVRRYELHYRQALRKRPKKHDLVLVTNNFVTGGAQTSARRLLEGMQARGLSVAAITLQEHPDQKSPGLATLGVECFIAPPSNDATVTVEAALDWLATDRLVFWNAIPAHKVLFAELFCGRIWDVSPGEMFYASLARYFAQPKSETLTAREYAQLLTGVSVKYAGEVARAEAELGIRPRVIMNGVPLPELHPRRPQQPFTIGTLARLSPDKKLEQLIDAWKRVPGAQLLIGGDAEPGSEAYAAELQASNKDLTWLGRVTADHTFFDRIDCFGLIAEPEGCPNAALEAMAHAVPICATDAGAARDLLGETGLLVPRGDSIALADAFEQLMHDRSLRASLAASTRARAEDRFSIATMVDSYCDMFGLVVLRSPVGEVD